MSGRWLVALGLLALLAACTPGGPSGSPSPGASVSQAAAECAPIDLRSPSGSGVQLTGVWLSTEPGVIDILQRGSCVYWVGTFLDSQAGLEHVSAFTGTIRSDFRITGRFGYVPFDPQVPSEDLLDGSAELRIDFDRTGEAEHPVLRGRWGDWSGMALVPEEAASAPIDIEGTFGFADNPQQRCYWVEANGQRFELHGTGDLVIRHEPPSVQDWLGHILAREGDPIRVHGRVSAALGSGCGADTSIMVETLDATP